MEISHRIVMILPAQVQRQTNKTANIDADETPRPPISASRAS